jgi:MFS family permease
VLLAGAPAGLLWAHLTPTIPLVFDDLGRPGLREYEGGVFFTVDVRFLVVTAVVGIVTGWLATRLLRRHGPALAAGLCVGGVLAGLVARAVGERVVLSGAVVTFCDANPKDGFCAVFAGRPELRSPQLLLSLAFAALVTHAAMTYFDGRETELVDAPRAGTVREVGQI